MSTEAIIMLALSIVTIWGGLLGAVLLLRAHPEEPERPEVGPIDHGPPRW